MHALSRKHQLRARFSTYTVSPTLLNEAAFNFNGNNIAVGLNGTYKEPSRYRVKQYSTGNTLARIPTINIRSSYNVAYDIGSWPWSNIWRSYQAKDDLSWSHGNHNVKFGFSWMHTRKNQQIFGIHKATIISMGRSPATLFRTSCSGSRSPIASYMCKDFVHILFNSYSGCAMDDWRIDRRLTLNLGLRWEGIPHASDENGRLSNFYPGLYNPAQAAHFLPGNTLDPNGPGFATVPGIPLLNVRFYLNGLGLAGRNGIPQGLVPDAWHNFAPRVGFALDVTGRQKTILRGGFGLFYERLGGNEEYTMGPNPLFSFNPNANNVYFSNPSVGNVTGAASATPVFPASFTGLAPSYQIPAAIQYNLGIQQQVRDNIVLSVAYVGNENYHQSEGLNINTVPQNDPNRLAICGRNCNYMGTKYEPNLDRPYQGWSSIALMGFGGTSNYNSLQVSVRATAWKNLTFSSSYTYSHAIDILDGELFTNLSNPFNAKYDRGSAGFDRRQIFVSNFVYDFPFFRNSPHRAVKAVIGGWTLSGIALFESGTPVSIGAPNDNLGLGGGTSNRADVVAPVSYPKTRFQWFSTSSFAAPAPLQWGTSGKNMVVGPGRNNWNMSLFKTFQFTEKARFEFRAETFNTFNHTQFTNLGATFGSGNFGQLTGASDPRVWQLGAKLLF